MLRLPTNPKKPAVIIVFFAVLGFLDAAYLTVKHYLGVVPPCSVLEGCEQVLTSAYATVSGVPISLPGALYYLAVLVLAVAFLDSGSRHLVPLIGALVWTGLAATLFLVYVQFFVLNAICLYCMGSAVTTLGAFTGYQLLRRLTPPPPGL